MMAPRIVVMVLLPTNAETAVVRASVEMAALQRVQAVVVVRLLASAERMFEEGSVLKSGP